MGQILLCKNVHTNISKFMVISNVYASLTKSFVGFIQCVIQPCSNFIIYIVIILHYHIPLHSDEDDSGRRRSLVTRYDSERGHLLEQLVHVGQSNSAMALAEKYHDFPTLLLMCERASEAQRSEMLHSYMVKFRTNVSQQCCCKCVRRCACCRDLLILYFNNTRNKVSCKLVYIVNLAAKYTHMHNCQRLRVVQKSSTTP